jgi:hypothetical protein
VRAGRADLGMAAIELYPGTSGVPFVEYFRMPQALVAKAKNPLKPALQPDLRQATIGTLTVADARKKFHDLSTKGKVRKSRGYEGEPALIDALAT